MKNNSKGMSIVVLVFVLALVGIIFIGSVRKGYFNQVKVPQYQNTNINQ